MGTTRLVLVGLMVAVFGLPMTAVGQTPEEASLWGTVENSTNPDDFNAYLDAYPAGAWAPLAKRRLAALLERARAEREKTDATAASARAAADGEARRAAEVARAAVTISVRHNHDGGVLNILTAGATIGECDGQLLVNRLSKTVVFNTTSKDSFQAQCADIQKLGIRRDGYKTDWVDFRALGRRYNFIPLADDRTSQAIVELIRTSCAP